MVKAKNKTSTTKTLPHWVSNMLSLMEQQGLNPRSLSLKAGLNPTAVRDMIEGRSRFPRYDTAQALAEALGTTPSFLMSDKDAAETLAHKSAAEADNLELLTEILTRLQETSADMGIVLSPRDFAAMAATIYHRMQAGDTTKKKSAALGPQIHDLMDYELRRQKRTQR